jgi:hypothetical protein
MSLWRRINAMLDAGAGHRPHAHERESPRFDTGLVVSFDGESAAVETRGNVGIGGFCFHSERDARCGQVVDLLVDLEGMGEWVLVRGEVLGRIPLGGGRSGLRGRFTRIAFDDERRLARWLDRRAKRAAA